MNNIICGVIVDENLYREYQTRKYTLKSDGNREVGISTVEIIAKSKDYKDYAPEMQEEAIDIYGQVQSEIKKFYNNAGGFKAMKHSNFKDYVSDIQTIYDNAARKIADADTAKDREAEIWADTQQRSRDENTLTRGKARWIDAQDSYKEKVQEIKESVKEDVKTLSDAFTEHLTAFYMLNPEKLDANTVTLLNANINLDDSDYAALVQRNSDNPTMLRVIGSAAGATGTDAGNSIAIKIKNMGKGNREKELFDKALQIAESCISNDRKWREVNLKALDRRISEINVELDSLIAKP